jgi:DNA adenine methylase
MSEVESEMKVTALAPWFGGKRTMALDIVKEFGPHRSFWEVPCGSMAVTLAKEPSAHETVVDLHGDLITLAMVVASDYAPTLYERLQRTLYADATFEAARLDFMGNNPTPPESPACVTAAHIIRAYNFFLVSWMGRNGVAGTERINYQLAVRWTHGGGHGGVRFTNAVESLPFWHRRLRRVVILCRDMFDVLAKIDDAASTVIYCDPPYLLGTRGDGGGSRYEHDFSEETNPLFGLVDDHSRLATALRRFTRARVVLSYYDCPRVHELYPGWTVRNMTRLKALSLQNKRGAVMESAPEMLLINGPSLVTPNEGDA